MFLFKAYIQPTSWLLCMNSIVAEILAGKLINFEEALRRELSRVKYNKLKVENKISEAVKTYEAFLEKGKE